MPTGDEQTRASGELVGDVDSGVRDAKPASDLIDELLRGSVRAKLFGDSSNDAPKLGRLVVLEPIGTGAMGTVFSAFDPTLDRKVAVKVLRGRGDQTESLLSEARALSKLNHPNVVSVFDAGEVDGSVFLVMAFVTGPTFDRWLDANAEGGGARNWRQITNVLRASGRGLAAAHEAGLVHCDVKPANIVVSADRPRVLDFGLAKVAKDDSSETQRRGAGTPNYMAPEVLAGGSPSALSDQFSLAVTAFEALFGTRPHNGESREQLLRSSTKASTALAPKSADVPTAIEAAIRRALASKPTERFSSMSEFVAALSPRKSRWGYLIAALLAAMVVGVLSYVGGAARSDSSETCDRGARDVAAFESSARFTSARSALDAQSPQWSERAFNLIEKYQKSWAGSYQRVCSATRVDGGQSETLLDLRMQCLSRRAHQVRALVSEIATINDRKTAARVGRAVLSIDSPEHCETTTSGDLAEAADAETLALRLRAQNELDRGWVNYSLARYPLAKESARDKVFDRVGAAPRIRAEQMLLAATIEGRTGNSEIAQDQLHKALAEAATAVSPRLEVRIWRQLLRNELFGGDPSDVVKLVPFAEAALSRLGDPSETVADIQGEALRKLGDLDKARNALARASSVTKDSMRSSFIALNLGALELEAGRPERARVYFRSGLNTTIDNLGGAHPQTALFLDRLGESHLAMGELSEAMTLFDQSLTMRVEIFGSNDRATGSSYLRRGRAHLEALRLEAAKVDFDKALSIRRASYGTEHRRTAEPLEELGDLALARGDRASALEQYGRAHQLNPDSASAAKAIDVALEGNAEFSPALEGSLVALESINAGFAEPSASELWALLARVRLATRRGETDEVRSVVNKLMARLNELESLGASHSLVLGRILQFVGHPQATIVLENGLKNTAEKKSRTGAALQAAISGGKTRPN